MWASFDEQTGSLAVGQMELDGTDPPLQQTIGIDHPVMSDLPDQILIAALGDTTVEHHFNGKIEAPQIYSRAIHGGEVASGAAGSGSDGCVAFWDFSQGISTLAIKDLGPVRPARRDRQSAGTGHDRLAVARSGNVLAACAGALRRDPLP